MISMVLRGGIEAKTTSVLLTKHLRTVPCLRDQAFHHCGDLDPFLTCSQTSVDFSNHLVLFAFGKCTSMVYSPSLEKTLGLRPTDQSCHHETWLHLEFVDWSNTWSKQDLHERRISLKDRPAECSHGNPKRRISEVMSDHSLSS